MSNFRSLDENELYRRVDEVLHYVWDPIGVSYAPEARDEYHSYLPHVFNLLKQGANESKIADYLGEITSGRMGLGLNRARDLEIAGILMNWRSHFCEK
jgi:hypothetical protein